MRKMLWCAAVAVFLLAACGGSDGPSVSGTASAGKQIAGIVRLKDSAGTETPSVAIAPDGRFAIPVAGLQAPYVIKAEGRVNGQPMELYSFAAGAGTANVNPMTDLVLRIATGVAEADVLWEAPGSHAPALADAPIATASAKVVQLLQPFMDAHGAAGASPFTDPIRLGSGLDAVFDRVALQIDAPTGMLTVASRVTGGTLTTVPLASIDSAPLTLAGHPSLLAGPPIVLGWYGPSSMRFGAGLDYVSEEVAGTCIAFGDPAAIMPVGSVQTQYSIEVLDDSSHVSDELDVSATAKMRMGLFKGSARATFSQQSVRDSTSVYVAVYADVLGYSFNLNGVRLQDGWRDKYGTSAFRDACGDRFLATITTGGKMVGILRITTTSDEEKRAITSQVKAKAGMFNSYSGEASLKSTMDSLTSQYQASITMFEMGPAETSAPTDYNSFMAAVQAFPAKVSGCLLQWNLCAYKVTFVDYATIAGPGTDMTQQHAAMASLIGYDTRYEQLLSRIADIQARPELYVNPPSVDVLTQQSDQITSHRDKVLEAAGKCDDASSACAVPAGLLDPSSVKLAARRLVTPHSCRDYKSNFPNITTDGEYQMYLGPKFAKPFRLYCLDMATANPRDFLTLQRTSPASTNPSYNYASSVGDGDAFTVFSRIAVQVNAPTDLAVRRDQYDFAVTRKVGGGSDTATLFGQARTSYQHSDWDAALQGHANIDLTGTPFALAQTVGWTASGGGSEFTAWYGTGACDGRPNCNTAAVISSDRKQVKLNIAGYPGTVAPNGDIRLDWSDR